MSQSAIPAAPPPAAGRFLDRRTPPHIGTLVAITSLSALTMSIYLPSLPSMARHFHTEYWVMQLSVSLYFVGSAVLQLIVGPLSDKYGRRPVLLSGFAVFIAATLACLFAPSVGVFLAGRTLQAAIVTAMALSRAVVRDVYDTTRSAAMIGYVMMGMSVVPMIGPTLGGLLDQAFSWKATFWLLLLLGVGLMALSWADLGETARARGRPFGAQLGEYPLLLASPRFWGYTLSASLASGMFYAFLGGAPFVAVAIFGLSPAGLGIGLGAPSLGYFFGNFLSARLSVAVGIDRMVLFGCLLATAAMIVELALFAAGLGGPVVFFGTMVVVTIGNGMTMPNTVAGMLSVRPNLAGSAAGLGGALQIGGGAALVALAGSVLSVESGAAPLLWVMLVSSLGSTAAIVFVILRTRRLRPG